MPSYQKVKYSKSVGKYPLALRSINTVCGKPYGKVSPILVTLTSRSDSTFRTFERLSVSLKENKLDGVNPNSNDIDYYVRKNEGKIPWFSAA